MCSSGRIPHLESMNSLDPHRCGVLCVVSCPSGSGKTTLCRRLSEEDENIVYAVSATTRAAREGEQDGIDYHFLDRAEFELRAGRGEFLEFAEVHGNYYGTLEDEVLIHIGAGRDVPLDLDVQGAASIRANHDPRVREAFVDIFILPRSREELLERLRGRGTESREQLDLRLRNALQEMRHWDQYAYTIPSGSREEDFAVFRSIIESERHRSSRLMPACDRSSRTDVEGGDNQA